MAEIAGNQQIEEIKKMLDELMAMQKRSEQAMLAAIEQEVHKQVEKQIAARYNRDVRRLEEQVEKKIAEAVKNLAPKLGSTISNMMSPALTKACKSLQGEMGRQISAMVPQRLETTVVKTVEDAVNASSETLWTCFQEENSKQKSQLEEHRDLILGSLKESLTQELPSILEKILKEIASEAFQEALKSVSV